MLMLTKNTPKKTQKEPQKTQKIHKIVYKKNAIFLKKNGLSKPKIKVFFRFFFGSIVSILSSKGNKPLNPATKQP